MSPKTLKQMEREALAIAKNFLHLPFDSHATWNDGTVADVAAGARPLVWIDADELDQPIQEILNGIRSLPQIPGLVLRVDEREVAGTLQVSILFGDVNHFSAWCLAQRWRREGHLIPAIALEGLALGYSQKKIVTFLRGVCLP